MILKLNVHTLKLGAGSSPGVLQHTEVLVGSTTPSDVAVWGLLLPAYLVSTGCRQKVVVTK